MLREKYPIRLVRAALVGNLLVILAACGGGGGSSAASTQNTVSPSPAVDSEQLVWDEGSWDEKEWQ